MLFNRCWMLVVCLFLTACMTTPTKTDKERVQAETLAPVTDFSDYAALGLLVVDQDYRSRLSETVALLAKGNKSDAGKVVKQLDRLISERPDLTIARYNKALLMLEQASFEQAHQLLSEAHGIDPTNDRICNAFGRLLRTQGQFKEAETLYAECLSYEGQSAVVHKNYGILLDLYLQQPERALAQYQTYLSMTGENDRKVQGWVLDLQRRLKVGAAK